jgi:hypothetical protein
MDNSFQEAIRFISSHSVPHVASGKQQLPVSHKVDILHFETRAQGLFTSNSLRNE